MMYAIFHELWGYCVKAEYPAQWLLHIDGSEALLFPSREAAEQAASKWDHQGHIHIIEVSKRAGYAYALEHSEVLFAAIVKAVEVNDTIGAVDVLSTIPGLGIVKASFVAQIVGLQASCLDGHNLKRLGLGEAAFKLVKSVKPETKRAKIAKYLDICTSTGGAEYWWNTWCEFVAGNKANKKLSTADVVSAYHVECLA
jgi:hypothetical protein